MQKKFAFKSVLNGSAKQKIIVDQQNIIQPNSENENKKNKLMTYETPMDICRIFEKKKYVFIKNNFQDKK